MQQILKRYGLLMMALPAVVICAVFPQYLIQLRYFHVFCIIFAAFYGKYFIQAEDLKGWLLQNAALLVHAACLIGENILTRAS